jgi:citrate lyase subunit beta/citryl-CoA lyase
MSVAGPPIRSYLYVPGDDSRRIEKALATGADAVVIDLEDAVAPSRKEEGRKNAAEVLESEPAKPIFVRVNALGSELAAQDIDAVAGLHLAGLRLPKVESPEGVRLVAETLEERRSDAGIHCLVESALGLELAF